jgi:hypothetical protein
MLHQRRDVVGPIARVYAIMPWTFRYHLAIDKKRSIAPPWDVVASK